MRLRDNVNAIPDFVIFLVLGFRMLVIGPAARPPRARARRVVTAGLNRLSTIATGPPGVMKCRNLRVSGQNSEHKPEAQARDGRNVIPRLRFGLVFVTRPE